MESVLEEWKVRSKNLLKNVINRGKSVIQKRRVYEIAILLGYTLFMCTMQEGRFVKQKEYRLETVDETSLEEVFCRAKKDGFTNNYLWWIATTSSEKIKIRKYPYMTEEELSETLYWEEDRLFGNTPIESSYRILSQNAEGYEVIVSAIPKDYVDMIVNAAKKAGKIISKIGTVVDLFLIEAAQAPKILLLGGNKEGRLVSWDGQSKAATYSLSLFDQESENVNFIMNKIKMNYINKEIYFFPYAEGIQVAKKWIELLKLHGFTVFNIKEISWAAKNYWKKLVMEIVRCMPYGEMNLTHRGLRNNEQLVLLELFLKGICFLSVIFVFLSGVYFSYQEIRWIGVKNKTVQLQPLYEEYLLWKARNKKMQELAEELTLQEKENGHWQKKLIFLSDVVKQNIVLSSLVVEDASIKLEGSATSDEEIKQFAQNLEDVWEGHIRIESIVHKEQNPLFMFRMVYIPNEDNHRGM